MSAAFTPGPWEAWQTPDEGVVAVRHQYRDSQGRRVTTWPAVCNCNTLPNKENAQLISAAPELYDALIQARSALWAIEDSAVESGFDKLGDIIAERLAAANSAIAKARGEAA